MERNAYKDSVLQMKHKSDEENFDEAASQAYRSFLETKVPSEIAQLFDDPKLQTLDAMCKLFLLFYTDFATHISYSSPAVLPPRRRSQKVRCATTLHIAFDEHATGHESQHRSIHHSSKIV